MAEQPALRFAGLLRQLRAEAKLTQEELAEASSLSPRAVSTWSEASTVPPDARTLASGSDDGTTRLWNLDVQYAINRMCATAGGLTPQQRDEYIPQLQYKLSCAH